jgi:hypothetical protein
MLPAYLLLSIGWENCIREKIIGVNVVAPFPTLLNETKQVSAIGSARED